MGARKSVERFSETMFVKCFKEHIIRAQCTVTATVGDAHSRWGLAVVVGGCASFLVPVEELGCWCHWL